MRSMRIQAFLSCSFDPKDQEIVKLISSLSRGIDIHCVNVDKGYAKTPPDKAREMIADSHALIAIASRRDELKPGVYGMPTAVDEEMSMAYANNKPILLFVENGVDTSAGFVRNYCTFQEYDSAMILTAPFLEKAISALHGLKVAVITPQDLLLFQQGQEHFFAESIRWLFELVELPGHYTWRCAQTRRLRFTSRFTDRLRSATWAAVSSKDGVPTDIFKWACYLNNGTKPFKLTPHEEKCSHDVCELSIDVDPKPDANDILEYSTTFESPYINPIYFEDVKDQRPNITINGLNYICYDGHIPILRIKELKYQFRFPASYGLEPNMFAPFVGSYSHKVDYIVDSEMKRQTVSTESFAGNLVIEVSIQSPLLNHVYGLAWNPPKKP